MQIRVTGDCACTDDESKVIDGDGRANGAAEGAQIIGGVEDVRGAKGVQDVVSGGGGADADDDAGIIDAAGRSEGTAEGAQIGDGAAIDAEGVGIKEVVIGFGQELELADDDTGVVDVVGCCGTATQGAVIGGGTQRTKGVIGIRAIAHADDDASVVDTKGIAEAGDVGAGQSAQIIGGGQRASRTGRAEGVCLAIRIIVVDRIALADHDARVVDGVGGASRAARQSAQVTGGGKESGGAEGVLLAAAGVGVSNDDAGGVDGRGIAKGATR